MAAAYPDQAAWRTRCAAGGRVGATAALLFLFALSAMPAPVAAQQWDPAVAISAYSAALNAHDLDAGLALFDQYGSATDAAGHHFEGRAGLTEFLLGSGFANPSTRISTERLHIVANRAVWTYTCSCASGSTEVRLVLNHNKISVFAIIAPPAAPVRRADYGLLPWLLGLALVAGAVASGFRFGIWRARAVPAPSVPRPAQGRLLAALVQARAPARNSATEPQPPVHRS
jgi:hypothetical protein